MNQLVIPSNIDFSQLVQTGSTLTVNFQSNLIKKLVDLENVYKLMGFAHKKNAKRTLENNFTLNEEYKILLLPREQNLKKKDLGGRPEEQILLNVDTFKNLCMLTKSEESKKIRKYYIRLETIYNELIIEEKKEFEKQLEDQKKQLEEQQKQLEEKNKKLKLLENKPDTCGFVRTPGYNYIIKDVTRPFYYKIGFAENPDARLSSLNTSSCNTSLEMVARFKTSDKEFSEKIIHSALKPFRIRNQQQKLNEWFYLNDEFELAYTIFTVKKCIDFVENFNFQDGNELKARHLELNIQDELRELVNESVLQEKIREENQQKNIIRVQQSKNRSGNFKGTSWCNEKQLWKSQLQHKYDNIHLGYFTDEIDAAKIYNDYALFLNQTENTQFALNDIIGYKTVARNVVEENKNKIQDTKSSKFIGVSYDKKRKFYVCGIRLAGKTWNLGSSYDEIECAKLYNQQALYFNNTVNTHYKLNDIPGYTTVAKDIRTELMETKMKNKSSKYYGVSLTRTGTWACSYFLNNKKIHIGTYDTELEACHAYNNTVSELNKNGCNYKINVI